MVILIRCNDIVSDPRAMKYVKFLQEKVIEHRLIGWDRDGIKPELQNSVLWDRKAGFNVGGLKAVMNRIAWMRFVYKSLKSFSPRGASIHGCDLDSAFPAACYKLMHPSNKLIFDIFDWFSATLHNQKKYILLAFQFMEKFTVKHSDYIIICEPERIAQIPFSVPEEKIKLLPNIPSFKDENFLKEDLHFLFNNDLLTFSYVGSLVNERCLEEIVSLAEDGYINLAIAGFGNEGLESRLKSNKDCPNIKYYGKVKYTHGLNISYNSDVMYAMYATTNPNHFYAAPNKFYEAMFLGKPIFTTKGTIVEKKVENLGIGYTSGETKEDILNTIKSIKVSEIVNIAKRSRENWEIKFKEYTRDFLDKEYLEILK
jgi:hypothetical protein